MHTDTWTKRLLLSGLAVLITALAACSGSKSSSANPTTLVPTGAASSAQSAYNSITANPTYSADIAQAKILVMQCFAGTPLQQIHQIHLVFLSSASGKNGAAVTQARDTTFTCLGVPADQRTAFKNDAITAAEHGKVYTKAGAKTYLTATLPQLVLKYKGQAGYTPPASPGAGTVPGVTPAPSASAGA
jgi:hypothetical protein